MQLMKDISNVTNDLHYGKVLEPKVDNYSLAYGIIQKEMSTFISVVTSVVLPVLTNLTERLCEVHDVPFKGTVATTLNKLGKIPSAYAPFPRGPPPMLIRPVQGNDAGHGALLSTPLMDPNGNIFEVEDEFGIKNKDVAPFCTSPMVSVWDGSQINLYGVCMLIHIVNIETTKNFVDRTQDNQHDSGSLNFISTKTPLSKLHTLLTLFTFSVLSLYLATAVTILGNGNRTDAAHVLSIPIPAPFLIHYLPTNKKSYEYFAVLNTIAYMEGVTGMVHYSPNAKNKTSFKAFPNVLPKRTSYRMSKDGVVHFLLERRGSRRVFALFNCLGYFQFLPRLVGMMKALDPENPYPDAYNTVKDVLRGIRNQCILTAFFETPIVLMPRSQTTLSGILGTGSEKTVIELSISIGNTVGDDYKGSLPIAVRYNSGVSELKHLEVCVGNLGLIGNYRSTHLFMPVMKTADTVVKKGMDLRLLLEFISSVVYQLAKLNAAGYIHRDYKLKNVLTLRCPRDRLNISSTVIPLSPVCVPKAYGHYYLLSDFGHTAPIGRVVTCSTKAYADPCHIYRPAQSKLDVWCVGLTLFKLCTNATQLKHVLREFYKIFNSNKVELRQQKKMLEMGDLYKHRLQEWSQWWQEHIWNHIEHVTSHKNYVLPIWSPPNWSDDPEESHYMNYVFLADFVQCIKGCLSFDLDRRWSISMLSNWTKYWLHSLDVKSCIPPTQRIIYNPSPACDQIVNISADDQHIDYEEGDSQSE